MRIIYFGTPEFAVAPLDHLLKNGYQVAAVVTAPDKPAGRGKKLTPPPVKIYAESKGIFVFQPPKLKNEDFLNKIHDLKPSVQVVVAFRMMPRELWSIPDKGTFNLHASLLPQYRGAAPINWVLINGESETGLTTFFIDDKIDRGEIIFREKMPVGEHETAGELHDRMMIKGSELVLKTVKAIENGTVTTQPQPRMDKGLEDLQKAPKIFKDDCKIDWTQPAKKIHNLIRGLSPYPAAFSYLKKEESDEIQVKVFKSNYETTAHQIKPGNLLTDGKNYLKAACSDGFIEIKELQLAGKKRMRVHDFLRGFKGIEEFAME